MAIDDVYQLTIQTTVSAQVNMNTVAFRRTIADTLDVGEFQPVADALKEIHRPRQNIGCNYTSWKARQVFGPGVTWPDGPKCNPVGGSWYEGVFTGQQDGAIPGELLPQQCAMVSTFRTGTVGRRYRGRFYAGGWGETYNNAGTWDATALAAIQTAWNAFFTTYVTNAATNGWQLGVWSYRIASGCEPDPSTGKHVRVEDPNPDEAFTPLLAIVSRPRVYTQRRRVIGVGI